MHAPELCVRQIKQATRKVFLTKHVCMVYHMMFAVGSKQYKLTP